MTLRPGILKEVNSSWQIMLAFERLHTAFVRLLHDLNWSLLFILLSWAIRLVVGLVVAQSQLRPCIAVLIPNPISSNYMLSAALGLCCIRGTGRGCREHVNTQMVVWNMLEHVGTGGLWA
jgi:hypothetical protein